MSDVIHLRCTPQPKTAAENFNAISKELQDAAHGIDNVLDMAAQARALPLNQVIPVDSPVAQQGLAGLKRMRSHVVGRLVVFRDVLLPISQDVVNGINTFVDYLQTGEETFLELAMDGEVSLLAKQHADSADLVRIGYETLAADLQAVGAKMDDDLAKVKVDIDKLVRQHQDKCKTAKDIQLVSTGLAGAGVATGIVLACGLLGPGGLLFAPALAFPALGGCVAVGSGAAAVAQKVANKDKEHATALRETANILQSAHDVAQQRLPNAVDQFQSAMTCLAGFFGKLHAEIERMEAQACKIEERLRTDYRERWYKAMYKALTVQMKKVEKSCSEYHTFVSRVNIKVANLQYTEEHSVLSYIEDWFAAQIEHERKAALVGRQNSMPKLKLMWKTKSQKCA